MEQPGTALGDAWMVRGASWASWASAGGRVRDMNEGSYESTGAIGRPDEGVGVTQTNLCFRRGFIETQESQMSVIPD